MNRFLFLAIVALSASLASGHGGGLDKQGGHNDRKNGGYHCHTESCHAASTNDVASEKIEKSIHAAGLIPYKETPKYDRDDYSHWSDDDGDCLNTRHEVLQMQSKSSPRMSNNGCYVVSGQWFGEYSGKTYTRAKHLDVDHIIPLSWAHHHGAYAWSDSKKKTFANDYINLIAVDSGLNRSKSAKGPTEWMPPRHEYRCEYLNRWVMVMNKYPSLKMTSSEHRTFSRQLNACGLNG